MRTVFKKDQDLEKFIESFKNPRVSLIKIKDENFIEAVINATSWLETVSLSCRIYHLTTKLESIPKCPICQIELQFRNGKYPNFCSGSCELKNRWNKTSPENREKIKKSQKDAYMMKYGSHPFANEKIKLKIKNIFKSKYGVEHPSQIKEIKENKKATTLEHFWHENPGQIASAKKTRMERYGVENVFSSIEIQEVIKQTNLKKYGVEYPIQNSEIFEKIMNRFRTKEFISASNTSYFLQGYEMIVLEHLLNIYEETDILHGMELNKKIQIWYENDGKKHRYFPDFYILSTNTIVEVKSDFTLKRELEKNIQKRNASLARGFNFQFWIANKKKILAVLK